MNGRLDFGIEFRGGRARFGSISKTIMKGMVPRGVRFVEAGTGILFRMPTTSDRELDTFVFSGTRPSTWEQCLVQEISEETNIWLTDTTSPLEIVWIRRISVTKVKWAFRMVLIGSQETKV